MNQIVTACIKHPIRCILHCVVHKDSKEGLHKNQGRKRGKYLIIEVSDQSEISQVLLLSFNSNNGFFGTEKIAMHKVGGILYYFCHEYPGKEKIQQGSTSMI